MQEHIEAALMKAGAQLEKKDQRIKRLEQERDEAVAKCNHLEYKNKGHVQHLEDLDKIIDRLRAVKFTYVGFSDDAVWIWNTDEPNYIKSLTCPIFISQEDLVRIANNGFNGIEEKQ